MSKWKFSVAISSGVMPSGSAQVQIRMALDQMPARIPGSPGAPHTAAA